MVSVAIERVLYATQPAVFERVVLVVEKINRAGVAACNVKT